jgi:hypothetical protein
MKRSTLKAAKPEDVVRLAKWLKLRIDGMKHKQIVSLVYWLLSREEKRKRNLTWSY